MTQKNKPQSTMDILRRRH